MMRLWFAAALCISIGAGVPAQAQDKVSFPSTDADLKGGTPTTITGYLYKPEGPGPFPAVIGLHGCNGLVDQAGKVLALYGTWGKRLSKDGYLVLLPDSFGSRGHGDLCAVQPGIPRPVQADREMPRDSYGALAYLRTRPDLKPNRIAILGQSFGAIAMFYTIAEGARPKELSAEQDFRAAIAFYPFCPPLLAREPKWKPRQRLLLLMGEADNFTPAAPCKELVAAVAASGGPPIEAHWYPGAYHAFDHPDLAERVLTNVKLPPDGHSPTVGSNPEARADAILKVEAFLAANLN
jgi:dienelactone hydrolase